MNHEMKKEESDYDNIDKPDNKKQRCINTEIINSMDEDFSKISITSNINNIINITNNTTTNTTTGSTNDTTNDTTTNITTGSTNNTTITVNIVESLLQKVKITEPITIVKDTIKSKIIEAKTVEYKTSNPNIIEPKIPCRDNNIIILDNRKDIVFKHKQILKIPSDPRNLEE